MNKVSIKNREEGKIIPTDVEIDGQKIDAVSVKFEQSVETVPECTIEVRALPDIETLAEIHFRFTPDTVNEAARVLQHNLSGDTVLYGAFIACIKSAMEDNRDGTDLAKHIADRIIGIA